MYNSKCNKFDNNESAEFFFGGVFILHTFRMIL